MPNRLTLPEWQAAARAGNPLARQGLAEVAVRRAAAGAGTARAHQARLGQACFAARQQELAVQADVAAAFWAVVAAAAAETRFADAERANTTEVEAEVLTLLRLGLRDRLDMPAATAATARYAVLKAEAAAARAGAERRLAALAGVPPADTVELPPTGPLPAQVPIEQLWGDVRRDNPEIRAAQLGLPATRDQAAGRAWAAGGYFEVRRTEEALRARLAAVVEQRDRALARLTAFPARLAVAAERAEVLLARYRSRTADPPPPLAAVLSARGTVVDLRLAEGDDRSTLGRVEGAVAAALCGGGLEAPRGGIRDPFATVDPPPTPVTAWAGVAADSNF